MTEQQYTERAADLLADSATTVKFAADYLSLVSDKHNAAIRVRLWQKLDMKQKFYDKYKEITVK